MKLIKESYKLVSGEAVRSATLMIQFFLFTIVICLILGRIECSLKLEARIKDAGLYNAVHFYPNWTFRLEQPDINSVFPEDLRPIGLKTLAAFSNNGNNIYTLNVYDNNYWKLIKYDLSKGRRLKDGAVNEAVISADLAALYRVGDVVELEYGKPSQSIKLLVVGVLAEKEQMLSTATGGSGNSLESMFKVPDNTFFTSRLSDENGNEPRYFNYPGGFIYNTQGFSCEQLNHTYESVGEFMAVKDIVENSYQEKDNIVRYYGVFALIILIISVLGISINNLYTLRLNEKAFAIYYLSGLTLTGFTKILFIRAFIICALPVAGALCIFVSAVKMNFIGDVVFSMKYSVGAFVFAAAVSLITSLPLYRKLKYTEPAKLFKTGV
jgi:ABC-type antimicrobial peptide transport system permease subunit